MSAGIYIHIPFCKSRCSYCDFATDIIQDEESVGRYTSAVVSEIEQSAHATSQVNSIYFGGGTPSLLSVAQLKRIADEIDSVFKIDPDIEFTVEMNPATVTPEKLDGFRDAGVNRASFGVQTFDETALKLLARGHDAGDARQTYRMLRDTGFSNISFDMIAGLPNQTLENWERNLDEALEMNPEHLSLYVLEIHQGTPLAEQIRTRRQPLPDEDLAGEMYSLMQEKLNKAGYVQYEISNFAKPGFEARHNNKYWKMEPVFGFGVSAHSFDGVNRRWANYRDTNQYVTAIETGQTSVATYETLEDKQLAGEFAFLNLRLIDGLNLGVYESRFGHSLIDAYKPELENLEKLDLIAISGNSVVLTRKGMLFSNEVFEVFV
ncbi:MAG: radical SAM family heme chaperone HemW [Pyrinomonadaceae bacterium]|nr:radical SAM family heme chaperone HemW [Pyrinomonadaceae bacterium]